MYVQCFMNIAAYNWMLQIIDWEWNNGEIIGTLCMAEFNCHKSSTSMKYMLNIVSVSVYY